MLRRQYRLKSSAQIRDVRHTGQSWRSPMLVLVKRSNDLPTSRFAFSVSRRIGNAVVRNRIKRWLREAIRSRLSTIHSGWDVLVIARSAIRGAQHPQIDRAVADLLRSAHLQSGSLGASQSSEENETRSPLSCERSHGLQANA
ncbi:MAG: ribonuclease P protein component [Anaerolineae bacterium]|nr:ribonuclease P protein component [Anaerolineae bacterium]